MNAFVMPRNEEQSRGRSRTLDLAICFALGLVTLAVYAQVRHFDFVGFDDPEYIIKNPHVLAGLSRAGLKWAFAHFHSGNWHPLTWLSHMLDCDLFGERPGCFHLTNVTLHLASSCLLYLTFQNLTRARWPSALVAALFALHPLHVESVAWLSERKDVLSTFFLMLAFWTYAQYAQKKSRNSQPAPFNYFFSLLFFALGLMAKPMIVTLPCVLLLLDFWPLRRWRMQRGWAGLRAAWPLLREKAPFFLLAIISCVVTYAAQKSADSIGSSDLSTRIGNALQSCGNYLAKTFWPCDLAHFYPYPKSFSPVRVITAALLLMTITVAALLERQRRPHLIMGWLWFLGGLMPVIGLVQCGRQAMADRFVYVPLIGLFIMLVWTMAGWAENNRLRQSIAALLAVAGLTLCAVSASHQVAYWRNSLTLFEHSLAVAPPVNAADDGRYAALMHDTMAAILMKEHDYDEAEFHLKSALRIYPVNWVAHDNLGVILMEKGLYDAAIAHFQQAQSYHADDAAAQGLWGYALLQKGDSAAAELHFQEALRLDPRYADAHVNYGRLLAGQGKMAEARAHFQTARSLRPDYADLLTTLAQAAEASTNLLLAVETKPNDAESHYQLAHFWAAMKKTHEAAGEYETAIRLNPNHRLALFESGNQFLQAGNLLAATSRFEQTLRVDPDQAQAHFQLATVLMMSRQIPPSILHYRETVRLQPDWIDALNNLAWILSTSPRPQDRNGPEAVKLSGHTVELTHGRDFNSLDTAAAALAEAGRFSEAVATCKKALALSDSIPQKSRDQMLARLDLYRARFPYRE